MARAWAGVWGVLTDRQMPIVLPGYAESLLRQIAWQHRLAKDAPEHWFTTLVDPPAEAQPIRDEIRHAVDQTLAS